MNNYVQKLLIAFVGGSLYVLQAYFEPEPREISKVVPGVKIRKP